MMVASGDIPATLCGPGFDMLEHPLTTSSARANLRRVDAEGIVVMSGFS
jgi:hypothetical protein